MAMTWQTSIHLQIASYNEEEDMIPLLYDIVEYIKLGW